MMTAMTTASLRLRALLGGGRRTLRFGQINVKMGKKKVPVRWMAPRVFFLGCRLKMKRGASWGVLPRGPFASQCDALAYRQLFKRPPGTNVKSARAQGEAHHAHTLFAHTRQVSKGVIIISPGPRRRRLRLRESHTHTHARPKRDVGRPQRPNYSCIASWRWSTPSAAPAPASPSASSPLRGSCPW